MDFFRVRATPGVERVTDGSYRRTFCLNKRVGHFTVEVDQQAEQLLLSLHSEDASLSLQIVERVRRMFDLDADPREVAAGLAGDKTMTGLLAKTPGLRLPGAFDPFETAVRALVGQQVSVKGATTVMGKIVSAYGRPHGEDWLFPTPAVLAELDPEHLPMPVARATAIRTMASRVASGELDLSMAADPEQLVADLQQIKGIGPWTAQYIVMRGLSYPNAFLEKDLVLLKAARNLFGISTHEELKLHSRHWTPWRAYACLLLWQHASEI